MTKGELRNARKQARIEGRSLTGELSLDRGDETMEFSAERSHDGSYNYKRAKALDRYARFVYEYDRD